MPLSEQADEALKTLDDALKRLVEIEETVITTCSLILNDKAASSVQRIQLANLLIAGSTDIRNSITRIQQALQQAKQL